MGSAHYFVSFVFFVGASYYIESNEQSDHGFYQTPLPPLQFGGPYRRGGGLYSASQRRRQDDDHACRRNVDGGAGLEPCGYDKAGQGADHFVYGGQSRRGSF